MADIANRPLSYSSLKAFWQSPKHYIAYLKKPYEPEKFAMEKASETLILEPEKFDKQFLVVDKPDRRTTAGKQEWERIQDQCEKEKLIMLTKEEYENAKLMAESVKNNPQTAYYLDHITEIQKKLSWTDKKTGLQVIGYADVICEIDEHKIIIDLKSTTDGSPNAFFKQAAQLNYDLQCGSYLLAFHKKYYEFPDYMYMVYEKNLPYNSEMIHCPADYCNDAKAEFEHMLTSFKYCMDNNLWHMGYEFWLFDTLPYFTMEMPRYHKKKFENK